MVGPIATACAGGFAGAQAGPSWRPKPPQHACMKGLWRRAAHCAAQPLAHPASDRMFAVVAATPLRWRHLVVPLVLLVDMLVLFNFSGGSWRLSVAVRVAMHPLTHHLCCLTPRSPFPSRRTLQPKSPRLSPPDIFAMATDSMRIIDYFAAPCWPTVRSLYGMLPSPECETLLARRPNFLAPYPPFSPPAPSRTRREASWAPCGRICPLCQQTTAPPTTQRTWSSLSELHLHPFGCSIYICCSPSPSRSSSKTPFP